MRDTTRDTPGTFFWKSENTTVKNVNLHYLHGFGMVGQLTDTVTLDNVNFETKSGTGRTTAGFADFVQMSSVKGKITIKNCSFSNPHDDPINIHGTYLVVTNKIADNKFEVSYRHNETGGFEQYFIGDEVEVVTKGTMVPIGETAKVIDVENFPNGDLNKIIITLDKDFPQVTNGNYAVENITYTPEVEIVNNVFKETPTRGILVTTRKPVVIRDNYFDGMGMSSIFISCDAQGWYESGPAKNVLIENNVFDRPQDNAILIEPTNGSYDDNYRIHQNIVIRNNIFNYVGKARILNAKDVKNLKFENNTINRYLPDVELNLSVDGLEQGKSLNLSGGEKKEILIDKKGTKYDNNLFTFRRCEEVQISNNTYDAGLNKSVFLYDNMTEEDITISGDSLKINESNQIDIVDKVKYVSSNENVAIVNENGEILAKSDGTAEIWAYATAGNKIFESNKIKINVTGSVNINDPDDISISSNALVININDTLKFEADINPENANKSVIWTVKDAYTGENTDKAKITNDGVLTGLKAGAVEVTAKSVFNSNISDSKLIAINESIIKNPDWIIQNEDKNNWNLDSDGKLTIVAQPGGSWANSGNVSHNIFLTDNILENKDKFEVSVKLTGKTKSGYEESGIAFYTDEDNYVFLQRKHAGGNPQLAISTEENASPNEYTINDIDNEEIYLKLEKDGNTYSGYYSTDNSTWIEIKSASNTAIGTDFKVGVIAANSTNSTPFEFEEFKINDTNISFIGQNNIPSISNLAIKEQIY